jgi:hypothetical protein
MAGRGIGVNDPRYLRTQAETCLRLASRTMDAETAKALEELAAEYERKARDAELEAGLNE